MVWSIFILIALAPYWAWQFIKNLINKHKSYEALERICKIAITECDNHCRILMMKYDQTVYKDEYGILIFKKFYKELDKFSRSVIFPKVIPGDLISACKRCDIFETIRETVTDRLFEHHLTNREKQPIPEHHKEFEIWCAQELQNQGWECQVTGGSGDQGADIIGIRNDQKLVVQCKKWSKPVDNTAVQQVSAARAHYAANVALVITTSSFTASARQLAQTNNVILLDALALTTMQESLN